MTHADNGSIGLRKRSLRLLLTLVLALAFGTALTAPASADTYGPFSGTVSSSGPSWATQTLDVTTPGYEIFTLDWDNSAANLQLGLKGPSGSWVKWATTGKPETITWNLATTGTWTLGISDKSGGTANYTLTVTDSQPPPPCTADFCGSVDSGGQAYQQQSYVVATAGDTKSFTLDWDNTSANLQLGLKSPSGQWVKWATGAKPEMITWTVNATGTWLLGVSDKAGGAANYTITIADATPPPTCSADFCGSVDASGKASLQFTVTVNEASNFTAILDWDNAAANLNLGLRTPQGKWVKWAKSTTAKPEDVVWPGATPGSYLLQVTAASGSANFTLSVYHDGATPPAPTTALARFETEFGYGPNNAGHAGLYPYGMKYDPFDNTVLVADVWNHRVLKFTANGDQVPGFSIPPPGAPRIEPYDLDLGPDGTIWIAQEAYTRIDHYSADGKTLIRSIGVNGSPGSNYPRGCGNGSMHWSTNIAVDQTNGEFYVSDGFCRDIYAFSQSTGQFLRAFNLQPSWFGVTQITPRGLDEAPDGTLVLAEHQSDKIADLNTDGTLNWVSAAQPDMLDPRGLAVDWSTGDIYVVGALIQNIFHFDSKGNFLDEWTQAGSTRFDSIRYITAYQGQIWVSDMYGYRVWHLSDAHTGTSSATPLTWDTGPQPPPNGGFNQVSGLGVDGPTGTLMAVDTFENRGQSFQTQNPNAPGGLWWCTSQTNCPAFQTQFGHRATNGISDTGFNYPRDATVGGGHLWTDGGQSVVEYNLDGSFANRWGVWGSGPGQFKTGPTGIFVVPDPNSGTPSTSGTVYTTDIGNCRLMLSDYAGNLIKQMGTCGTGANQMVAPWQVWVVGNLAYVIDSARGLVEVWNTSTSTMTTIAGSFAGLNLNQPKGLAVDPTGTWLYIADSGNKRIVRVELADTSVRQLVSTGYDTTEGSFSLPRYLAFDAAGNLYVSDFNQRIYVFAVGP